MRRIVAVLLAVPPLLYSGAALLWGYFTGVMQCDEICDPNSSDWRYLRDAWQWYAIGALGVVAFIAGIAFFLAIVKHAPVPALVWLLIGAGTVAMNIWKFQVEAGSDTPLVIEPIFYVVSAAVFAAGVAAIALVWRPATARTG